MASTKLVTTFILLSTLLFIAGCAPQTSSIGWMGPLSGDAASYGESIQQGVMLAQEQAGSQRNIIYEDSQCSGQEAASAMTKLATVDRVQAVIGEVCSGATLAAAPIAQNNEVVMISAASTSPELTNNAWVFRTVPSDALQGAFGAELVYEDGYEALAILHGNEEYGVGFRDVLEEEFRGEITATEAFTPGATDLRTQLTRIQASGAQAIFIISNSPDTAVAALQQIQELGLQVAVYGSEGLQSSDVLQGAGAAAQGLIVSSVSQGNEEFIQAHQEAYGSEPGPFAAQAYDAYTALEEALSTGASTGAEIREALLEVSFQGVSGPISFDENGDVQGVYEVSIVEEGAFQTRE